MRMALKNSDISTEFHDNLPVIFHVRNDLYHQKAERAIKSIIVTVVQHGI